MKLNLGCGEDFRPGWLNVDCRPLFPESEAFRCCDLSALDGCLEDGCIEEIHACNVLEYLSWRELDALLVVLGKKLRADGLLFLQVPNLRCIVQDYLEGKVRLDAVQRALQGVQGYPEDTRRNLWDATTLRQRLTMIGLQVERLEETNGQLQAWGRRVP